MDWMAKAGQDEDPHRYEADASLIVVAAPYAGHDRRAWDG